MILNVMIGRIEENLISLSAIDAKRGTLLLLPGCYSCRCRFGL
jgi:hypothetical protein